MAVWLREFRMEDIKPIDRIFRLRDDIGVPSLKNVIVNSTIIDPATDEVIGYGVVKMYAEAVIILDPTIRKRQRAEAVVKGLQFAINVCKDSNVEQLFLFSNTPEYTKVLKKRFDFKETSGTTLFLEFGEPERKDS